MAPALRSVQPTSDSPIDLPARFHEAGCFHGLKAKGAEDGALLVAVCISTSILVELTGIEPVASSLRKQKVTGQGGTSRDKAGSPEQ